MSLSCRGPRAGPLPRACTPWNCAAPRAAAACFTLLALGALPLAGCRATARSGDDAALVARWLTGTFSSAAQAKADPENFLAIRLVMVPIWTERTDGPWLYVEQAAERRLDRPYRQRVYHIVSEGAGRVRSDVYTLPAEALRYAGAWAQARPLGDLKPADLTLRAGCAIFLKRDGPERFVGSTRGKGCPSELAGASYATSQVTLTPARLDSWDRGFDAGGTQVWGATTGPYAFLRIGREDVRLRG